MIGPEEVERYRREIEEEEGAAAGRPAGQLGEDQGEEEEGFFDNLGEGRPGRARASWSWLFDGNIDGLLGRTCCAVC